MENIRYIKDKIKSCMSCNEDQCPFMRERLERHVLSHHSSTRQTVSSQQMKIGRVSGTLSSKSALTMTTSNEQTSTSDLIKDQLDKITKKTMYRNRLEVIISEWAKQLPKYPNSSAENLKQNIVNELIEKLNNMSSEANEGYYDLKLTMEIDKFIDSLPSLFELPENESDLVNLKEDLVQKICDLNNIISNEDMNAKEKKENNETAIKMKDNAANTQQGFKNNSKYTDIQNNKISTPYSSLSDNNESITEINLKGKRNGKKLVDAQVQQSFSSITPFYDNMFKKSIYKTDKLQNTNVMDNCYKLIISNWLNSLTRMSDETEKNIITDAVWNRLEALLNQKYALNHKLLIKAEILSCLNYYTNISIGPENYNQVNRISEDLAVRLLNAKLNSEKLNSLSSRSYFHNNKDKMLSTNFGHENYFDPIVQNIVSKNLDSLSISNIIKRDIINIITQNINLICMRQDHYIEALIFDILQNYTKLSEYGISNIVKSILDEIRIVATSTYLQIYNSVPLIDSFKKCRPSLVSVYKSEHEIRGLNNVPFRRKSSDSHFPQLTVEEKTYSDNISELIKAWMTMLPIKNNITGNKKNKDGLINNLVQDILDQVKLEQLVPETRLEKEKYLSFFIHRWLNRLNCFQNIADAQPYAEKLIEKLRMVPVPRISKAYNNNNQTLDNDRGTTTTLISCNHRECLIDKETINKISQPNHTDQNIANTLKSEAILKEFIAKYIEHNYDEDNPITREVFGHILKTELQKLSTPTRKKVYGNLTNQIDNILASEKLATELQYVNIISDWFKSLPMERSFNVSGNIQRAQYVNDLAKIMRDMEEDRLKVPPEMDYKKHLKLTVSQFINKLPITKYSHDMSFLIDGFIANIASLRPLVPCCVFANERDLSLNASSIPDQNLSDFIEAYIRDNSDEIAEDELKLDAWSLRIFEEVDNMASENPSALSTSQVYNRLSDISTQGDDIGKRFNLELSYAKEISNWLNNLPLQPITDKSTKDLRINMISNLAEKMSTRWHIKNIDPNNTQVDVDLVDYIAQWITELPLDRNKEIVLSLVIQQILNRMERVNTGKQNLPLMQQQPEEYITDMCKSPHPCCNRHIAHKIKTLDPGKIIVEAIENWCKNLPIQSENEKLQEEFSTKLYKKIGELNQNPDYFNNDFLYLQILGEEIDSGFDNLPQTPQLQSTRQKLKQEILDIINENRNLMREKAAGVEYRQELLNTIDMSIPNPIHLQSEHSPGFNIYKNRLVEMFILENFDHSQNDVKLNYVKRLRYEIDKYFQEAQNMNALPLTREQMFNELYSSLFSVQPPNETLIIEEVEEIKTRCEIDSWFKSLPIREATGLAELFEWDQILSMLAKRLINMERYEKNPDDGIHKEITKWLLKLPIVLGQDKNVNNLSNDLQQRLKLTINDRKCKSRDPKQSREESLINKNKNKGVLGMSQVAGPSTDGMPWLSPPSSPLPEKFQNSLKRPSDLILDIVETWCQQLPLSENSQQEKENAELLKDNLVVKIIMKISELNANTEIFENNILYDVILDDNLENLISTLPTSNELIQNKTAIKNQLKDAINSVKPLIQEEKARYEYKQELKNTVDQVLEQPPNAQPEKIALFITLRDEIVDNFVAYSFCKNDEEGQEVHKMMVQDAVHKYIVGKKKSNNNEVPDPLMKGNQLLCELAKVPAPSAGVILEEIQEIRMKFQISDLFKELSLTEDASKLALKNQVKSTLARRLSDFNKTSFIQNHNKVRDDIMKCLRKIQNEIDPQKVEIFIEKLETSENRRKSLISPENNIKLSSWNQNSQNTYQTTYKEGQEFVNNKNAEDEQWMSLLPATPRVRDPNYHDTIEFREFRKSLGEVGSPQEPGQPLDRSITHSGISYTKFIGGEALSSTVINKYQPINSSANSNDKPRCLVLEQGQCGSVHPSNSVVHSQGFQPIDNNNTNRAVGSSLRSNENSGQLQNSESNNIQPRFTQDIGVRPDLQKTFTSPQPRNLCSHSQQHIPPQIRKKSYTFIQNDPSQSQSLQQPRYMPRDDQNQMSTSAPNYQPKSLLTSSQMTLQSQDVPSQQNQYRSPFQQTTASQNIPESCRFTSPSDSLPPMPQFSSETPYSNSKCNKSCRRPSITLLKPPETQCNNNQDMQGNTITDDDETKCSCINKRRKQCRGSPVCPLHMRKQCKICNGVNPFNCSTSPYRRYYHY